VAGGAIPAKQLISRIEPFDAVQAAFAALEQGGSVMKVLLDWQKGAR
jgi:threonine dehydrogenase-like Zn-dependent dehydrogenase